MKKIYRAFCNWLNGEKPTGLNPDRSVIPEPVKFDTIYDAISLFAFGMAGSGNMKSDYGRIHNECNSGSRSADYVFNDIINSLIQRRSRYVHGNREEVGKSQAKAMTLENFQKTDMLKLFNGRDPQRSRISDNSAVTLSHFIYPLIMSFISKNEPAYEYYLILVSDFMSGTYSYNDAYDRKIIEDMTSSSLHPKYNQYFIQQINDMRAPYVEVEYLRFEANNNTIGAKGTRLMFKSTVQKPQIYLTSSLYVGQKGGNEFTISEARITFDKDSMTTVDSIQIVVREGNQVLCYKMIDPNDVSINEREYKITKQTVDLGKQGLGDLSISYILFTMSHDKTGESVLPVALEASQIIESDQIAMINQQKRKMIQILLFSLLALATLATLILRGRKKSLDAHVGRFAQKYVNVTENDGSVELPCWFHKDKNDKSIHVNAKVVKKKYSIGGNTKLFARLQDGTPNGFSYFIDTKDATEFIEVKKGKGGEYDFNINIAMDPNKVDPSELSTCKVLLDFKVESSLFGLFKHIDVIEDIDKIEFYFLNDLGTAWVGFDPGTTGSCVSYGCTGGALDNPNIKLVKVEGEEIIPSKLVLNKDFGETPVDQLTPGEDYVYGTEANRNWAAYNRQGMPCFQSIKKLLGYKNSADDMIDVNWANGSRALTGLQLAHLLVKGLKKELDSDINVLSDSDKTRYAGRAGKARRAVVAIPNNYTLPKITDMVNSVRMLHSFDEVRYIYEAEGILFNYFRKNYKHQEPGEEIIMVYDMGGATINLSVFKIEYTENNGTIYYYVHTLGRIGYAVGGDNIDVAMMEHLFTLKELQNGRSEEDRHDYQLSRKIDILNKVGVLKIDVVKAANNESLSGNQLQNDTTYRAAINDILLDYSSLADDAFSNKSTNDFINRIKDSNVMKKMVIDNVQDAIEEIMKFPLIKDLNSIDTLIFAGRSTMFPGIRETVTTTLKKKFGSVNVYSGFNADEIKTSVAYGACWYGIYNSLVTLDNSRLTSAYGFKHTTGGSSHLNVLLSQNDVYDTVGRVDNTVPFADKFNADGNVVDFYQVMGSGVGNNLFSEESLHKVNYIGEIDVHTTTDKIGISVDRRNVVTCTVKFNTGEEDSFKDLNVVGRDITKENDWAYIFAATPQTAAPQQQDQTLENQRSAGGRKRV